MKSSILLVCLIYAAISDCLGARPTSHATNLTVSNIQCDRATLNWSNGNGSARVVLMREGSLPDFVPSDGDIYTPQSVFGGSTPYGSSNSTFIIFNSSLGNSITVTNLKQGKTYYWTIYEHDNNGVQTLYYVSGAPDNSFTCHSINLDFNITPLDSCEATNYFMFTNASNSSLTGVTYVYDFGDTVISSNPCYKKLNRGGLIPVILRATTGTLGCSTFVSKKAKVFPKKMAYIDKASFKDSVQFFDGNYFEGVVQPLVGPFPYGFIFNWHHGDSTIGNFSKMKHSYKKEGVYRVLCELTYTSYIKPTACKDTLYQTLIVLHDPFLNMLVYPTPQYIDSNEFHYSNLDTTVVSQKWKFGDGDSSTLAVCTHRYTDTGTFHVSLYVETNFGYKGSRTIPVRVLPQKTADSTLAVQLISSVQKLSIFPNPDGQYVQAEIEHPELVEFLSIYDLNGKKLFETSRVLNSQRIDISEWPSATYILRISGLNGSMVTQTFIVKNSQ